MELEGKVVLDVPCASKVTIMPDGTLLVDCKEKVAVSAGLVCVSADIWPEPAEKGE